MPRVVSHSDVEAVGPGGTITVEDDAVVTPFALEQARALKVTIARGGGSGAATPSLVRTITRQVVARLPDAAPEVLEAVVAEVLSATVGDPIAASQKNDLVEVGPGIDYCAMCLEQERARTRTRAVLTTTGRNTKGIVARITARIAELGGDILDISQTLVGDYFTMIIVVDTASLGVPFADFKDALEREVAAMGLECMMMHEDVVSSLHRI
jgi:ACT domain-containing protein